MRKKYLLALCSLIFIFLLYWLKCQIGINFTDSFSLSHQIPFTYLQRNDVIAAPQPGTLLYDSFDENKFISNWVHLWMKEEGGASKSYDRSGLNNTRCLLIKSTSKKSWSLSHNKFIQVTQGDIFSFQGSVKLQGDNISAYLGVAFFDKNKNVIQWNYINQKTDTIGTWTKVEKLFTIPEGINYINFRLSGVGIGEFRFDDISFSKQN